MIPQWAYFASAVIIGCALFVIESLMLGCVQVGPKQFAVTDGIASVQHPAAERVPCACAKLPPIPAYVHIDIEPGKPVQADQGGEALIRAYVAAREKSL